ncbi:MAG TPA: YdcF family protein [Rhizomicrobium sp.]
MFFVLSKLLIPLQTPSDLILLILSAGVICCWFARSRRLGIWLASLATATYLLIFFLPVSDWVTAPLENRFPQLSALPGHVDGIIVLGGAVNPEATAQRGRPTLNSEAERMTEFVRLAKHYPEARLVFSGGSGLLDYQRAPLNEADVARQFFEEQGLDPARMTFENKSRNTYENIVFTKALIKPQPGESWLLVSSARDIPRSMGIFRKQHWAVVPVPVAYKSDGVRSNLLGDNLQKLDRGVHEWLGLLVYRITGKTDALFPAPAG